MPTMRDVIQQFMGMPSKLGKDRSPGVRPKFGDPDFPDALAEYIAAEAGPLFDEVVRAAREVCANSYISLTIDSVNSGHIRAGHLAAWKQVQWPGSDDIGRAIMAAIKAAMKLEPTAAELFDQVAVYAHSWQAYLQRGGKLSSDIGSSIDAVREALKGDG